MSKPPEAFSRSEKQWSLVSIPTDVHDYSSRDIDVLRSRPATAPAPTLPGSPKPAPPHDQPRPAHESTRLWVVGHRRAAVTRDGPKAGLRRADSAGASRCRWAAAGSGPQRADVHRCPAQGARHSRRQWLCLSRLRSTDALVRRSSYSPLDRRWLYRSHQRRPALRLSSHDDS